MNDKDKIIDIAKVEFDIQFGCGDYIEIGDKEAFADSLADTLIENGIGDISEWKARTEIAERALYDKCEKESIASGCPHPLVINYATEHYFRAALQNARAKIGKENKQ